MNCPGLSIGKLENSGDILTYIPVPNISSKIVNHEGRKYLMVSRDTLTKDKKKLKKDFKTKVLKLREISDKIADAFFSRSKISEECKRLVQEVIFVVKYSTLMWPGLVNKFTKPVQDMCKNLQIINKDIMNKVNYKNSEYFRALAGIEGFEEEIQALQNQNETLTVRNETLTAQNEDLRRRIAVLEAQQNSKLEKIEYENQGSSECKIKDLSGRKVCHRKKRPQHKNGH